MNLQYQLKIKNNVELKVICDRTNIDREQEHKLVTVFEDNEGAMKLANSPLPRISPQSKHFGVKYHWFREKLDELQIQIKRVFATITIAYDSLESNLYPMRTREHGRFAKKKVEEQQTR